MYFIYYNYGSHVGLQKPGAHMANPRRTLCPRPPPSDPPGPHGLGPYQVNKHVHGPPPPVSLAAHVGGNVYNAVDPTWKRTNHDFN